MRIGSVQFRPAFWPTLAFVLTLPGLIALGFWQLDRAAEKRALYAAFDAGAAAPARAPGSGQPERYAHLRLEGHYLPARQFLLDNMTHDGRAGYQVLTPFRLQDGRVIIVNRGWLPRGGDVAARLAVPGLAAPRSITGRADRLPVPGLKLDAKQPATGWPRVMQFPSLADLETALGRPLGGYTLLLDPQYPHGFVREWQPASFGPARHQAYALQWFGLALALAVIYVVVNIRRTERKE